MLNYIWFGLIVIAVAYAGFRDLNNDPPVIAPSTFELSEFSNSVDISVEPDEAPLELSLGSVAISVGDDRWNTLVGRGAPDKINFTVRGDVVVSAAQLIATDEDGNRFAIALGGFGPADEGKTITGTFKEAKLLGEGDSKLTFPLTMTTLSVTATEGGRLVVENATLSFPRVVKVGSAALESKSWMGVITASTAVWAKASIDLAIGLIGIMMLWLGLMRIAEAAGLVQLIAKFLKPLMVRLYPDLPPEGEAMGAIIMNIAANMLGLGNAATPLGLKAMEEIQKVNPNKEYASNAMCMLLAMNTSSVTIITPTIIAFRVSTGSTEIMKFWPVMIGATLISTTVAIIVCKLLERLPVFAIPPADDNTAEVKA